MGWVEVAKRDCRECGGTGVERAVHDLIKHRGIESLKRSGRRCQRCRGTGKESVGYQA